MSSRLDKMCMHFSPVALHSGGENILFMYCAILGHVTMVTLVIMRIGNSVVFVRPNISGPEREGWLITGRKSQEDCSLYIGMFIYYILGNLILNIKLSLKSNRNLA